MGKYFEEDLKAFAESIREEERTMLRNVVVTGLIRARVAQRECNGPETCEAYHRGEVDSLEAALAMMDRRISEADERVRGNRLHPLYWHKRGTIIREATRDLNGKEIDPAILLCYCGAEVVLDSGFTNTCVECERDYNWNGSLLAPREQWGEETGESVSDILSIR